MEREVLWGVLLPFLGTGIGAMSVLFLRREPDAALERPVSGFAAGVMVAASIWSLLEPAMEQSAAWGRWSFVPAAAGLWAGVLFLLRLGRWLPEPDLHTEAVSGWKGRTLTALAVTLHNVPEGMAVGAAYAAVLGGVPGMNAAGAFALSLGIAVQNVPEGAIISLPLRSGGMGKGRALLWGVLSGAVEPAAAVLTLLCTAWITPILPGLLGFAAGAMLCVVAEELLGGAEEGDCLPTLAFALGFTVMMALDKAM
jgi:ZIP family zinc transporter